MTWQHVFDLCRSANQVLGLVAVISLSARAVVALYDEIIVYRPMFALFIAYVLNAAVGAPISIHVGNHATVLSLTTLLLNVSLIAVCVAFPGPLRKADR